MEKIEEHMQSDGSVASELEGEERQQSDGYIAAQLEDSRPRLSPENRVEIEADFEATINLEEILQGIDSLLARMAQCRENYMRLKASLGSWKARLAEHLDKDELLEATALTDLQGGCAVMEGTRLWKDSLRAMRVGLRPLIILSKGLTISPELQKRLDDTMKLVETKSESEFFEDETECSTKCDSAMLESELRQGDPQQLLSWELENIQMQFQRWKLVWDDKRRNLQGRQKE